MPGSKYVKRFVTRRRRWL